MIDIVSGENFLKRIVHFPLYLFFLAAYPLLALLSYNISQVKYPVAIRSLIVSCLMAGVFFWFFRLIYHNTHKAAFVVVVWLLLFFSYGHVFDVISQQWGIPNLTRWMLVAWFLLADLVLILAKLRRLHFQAIALPLNIVSLGLLVYVLVPVIIWTFIRTTPALARVTQAKQVLQIPAGETPPDIYFSMPEDYGRIDQL